MSGSVTRIQLLNAENYDTWKLQMKAVLIKNDLWAYANGEMQMPAADDANERRKWQTLDQKASADIMLSVTPSELGLIAECSTSAEMWEKLESTFQSKGPARKATLLKKVALARMKDGDNVREHLNDFFDAVSKLKEIKIMVGDDLLAILLLYSLPSSYETFRCALETRDELPSPEILRVKILEEDQSRRSKNDRDDQGALYVENRNQQKSNRSGQKEKKKKFSCFKCGKLGHFARNCRNKQANICSLGEKAMHNTIESTTSMMSSHRNSYWCLDSGSTAHMCADKSKFENFKEIDKTLNLANTNTTKISGVGNVQICVNANAERVNLQEVFCVEDLRENLLSVSKITDRGFDVHFCRSKAEISERGRVLYTANRFGNLYYLQGSMNFAGTTSLRKNSLDEWHYRLGHLNEHDLKSMSAHNLVFGMKLNPKEKMSVCEICLSEKQTRQPFARGNGNRTTDVLEIVHSDVCGPMRSASHSGAKYFVTFTDDYSRYCEIFVLKQKSDVLDAFRKFKNGAENLTGRKIKYLQSDNGREYCNNKFNNFLDEFGIKRRLSAPHTPQQNGVAERKNRTLLEMARCMLKHAGAPPKFWAEAISTACYIRNRCPTKSLNGGTPYGIYFGKTPSVKHMKMFGSVAYVLNKGGSNGKFDSRSEKCVMVGYSSEAKAYRLWCPGKRNIIISRDVKILDEMYFEGEYEAISQEKEDDNFVEFRSSKHEAHENASQNGNSPGNHDSIGAEGNNEDSSDFEGFEDCNLLTSDNPTTLAEALQDGDESWRKAIEDEFIAHLLNGTWDIVERPKNRKVIGNRFVFRTKENGKRKVRMVAKGCSQRQGEDFTDTYSPVVRSTSVKLLSALSAKLDLEIHQMDVVTAYLNGEIVEDVFMEIPENLYAILDRINSDEVVGTSKYKSHQAKEMAGKWLQALNSYKYPVCKIVKAIYGLRQSGLRWYQTLTTRLQQLNLNPSKQDPCLFVRKENGNIILVTIYVDDLLIASNNRTWLNNIKRSLAESFEMKDLGPVKLCLGIEFLQNLADHTVFLNQHEYTKTILERFNMSDCKPVQSPMVTDCKLQRPDYCDEDVMRKYPYQNLIGALMFLAVNTRPDIAFSVNFLSQFNTNFNELHWQAAKRILRYLKGTLHYGILYRQNNKELFGVVDADWGANMTDRRSYSGYAFILSGAAICWEARKQRTVSLSSTESEYLAISEAAKEALYLRTLLAELGLDTGAMKIYNDSQSAQKLANSFGFHSRTKHIDIRHHFIRQVQQSGDLCLEYMPTEEMPADVLTKGLSVAKHQKCMSALGMTEGGDIVLNNLRIRENALDDLELPVQLVYGHLGKFVLKIPWKSIYNQPVVAQIEDLFLLVSPKQSVAYDAEKEQKLELDQKQIALKAIDEAFQKELEKDANKADPSYVEKLVARTINNIQVKIANVHVRYEDNSKPDRTFAFGITLNNFEIFTTDKNWQKCFVDGVIRHVFKLATLDCLSVYMNCSAETYNTGTGNEIIELFRNNIASKTKSPNQYSFLLGPISSVAKLLLNSDPNRDNPPFTIPKTDLTLEMEKLNVAVTTTQFQLIVGLLDDMNQFKLAVPYRKYRPYNKPYKGNARLWWTFAIESVLEEQIRKKNRSWTWEHIKEHRELCKIYAEAHKERCASKKPSATVEATCTIAEQKLDLFNLILIRKRVQLEVDRLRQGEESRKEAKPRSSWFSGWFAGDKKDEDDTSELQLSIQKAMTPEEKRKLHKAIGYEDNMVPLELPDYYEAVHMKFTLKALEIGLYDDSDLCKAYKDGSVDRDALQTLMLIKLNMTTCTVKQRPAASAVSLCLGMKELALTGLEQDSVAPTIIKSKISDENNLLDIFFETNPLDKQCDQRIRVTARPLEIIYDAETVLKLMKVFVPQQQVNLSELEGAATLKISDFKERSATGMQYMIESHAIIELDVTLMPNILILPQGGKYSPGHQSLVIIGLGEFKISSAPHRYKTKDIANMHQGGKNQEEILQIVMDKAYDRYNVSIENIQIMVAKPEDDWELCMKKLIISDMHLLRPTSFSIDAELCVVDDDPRLPKTKINVLLPSINLNLTEDRVFEALRVAMSIPLPENENPVEQEKSNLLKSASQLTQLRSSMPQFLNQDERRKTLSATAVSSLTSEVTQYTSLEVHFALKQFSVALLRTSTDIDSPLSEDSEAFTTPSQHSGDSEFHDSRSSVSLIPTESQKLLAFQVLQVEVFMAQRTFEMVAQAKLGAISLTSYENRAKKEEELVVIETPGFTTAGKSLLNVTFTAVDKSTPDFITKYKSIEQLARINFATLNIILHQENLLHIMEIANKIQHRVEKIMAASKPVAVVQNKDRVASARAADGFVDRLARIAEETEVTIEKKTSTTAPPNQKLLRKNRKGLQKVVESIKMKIEADLDQVGLELTCRKRSLASLKVNHLYAGVVLKTSYTEVQMGLKDILISDMNPFNIHSNILSIVGKDALKCDVVLYNLDETRNYNSNDMKINVDVGCMKIVFVNWFVNSVLSFMNNFQAAQQAIASAGAMAADAAKQNAVAVYEKATRMKLNVKVKAPVIVVPTDSKSLEAVVLDLGQLTISNLITDISTPDNDKGPAVMDEIKLILKDMRLARVNILEESPLSKSQSFDTDCLDVVDSNYGFKSKVNILDPTSFTLVVKRNLSFSWYKDLPEMDISGRLRCIDLNLFMDDYALIMSILNRNMREGLNEFPTVVMETTTQKPRDLSPKTPTDSPAKTASDKLPEKLRPNKPMQEKISEQFKFNIQLDGVVLNLMSDVNEGLARFGLYIISLKGTKLMDETLTTNIVLCNMQLDDTRRNNTSEITKYLCRKDWFTSEVEKNSTNLEMNIETVEKCTKGSQCMLDITAVLKENDTVANVRISSFDLILCVDFLLKLTEFFKGPEEEGIESVENEKLPEVVPPSAQSTQPQSTQLRNIASAAIVARETKEDVKKINLTLVIDEPDIILVETLKDMNTSSIIFNMQAKLIYRAIGEKQLISGNIDGLKMYMCSFMPERREATRHYILHPCVINLHGSTPEDDGMNISLKTSEIIINISPATLELFNKAMQTINTSETDQTKLLKSKNYSNIWTPNEFIEEDYWFLKAESAEDALVALDADPALSNCGSVKTERCVIEIPSIMLVLEAGIGYYTTPLISMDTCLNAIANDWSSNLSVNGSLTLSMNYYNQSLAVWEPVIEQNEHIVKDGGHMFAPWELNFSLGIEKNVSEFEENKIDQTTTIKIHSEENLEITVSKTFLDLIGTLGEAFGQAMDPNGLMKPDVIAPYVIENDTGFDINLFFTSGIFTLHECHIPNSSGVSSLNDSIVFKNDLPCNVAADSIKCCTLSPGCKAYLQTKNLATIQNPDEEEYNVYVTVGHIEKQLVLPVSKSDKRYFSLFRDTNQDPWGIVSEVNSEYGTTTVNIHSVVNIQNHFTTSIKIFRMKAKSNQMILVGVVEPGAIYHVPLHAIYCEGKTLHFAIEDYHTSVQGIKWDDCPTDMNFMRHIQCDPIETFEPFFINVSREKTEVYHEHSNKFKLMSAYYTLHLRPPVYLRNALPINITVSVAGCSVREAVTNLAAQAEESCSSLSETDADHRKHLHQSDHSFIKEDLLDYGEKDIEAGSVLHLPTVKLAGRSKDSKSYLVVRMIQYLERDWSCTTEISENYPDVTNWKFSSYDSDVKMSMDLCVKFEDRNGSLLITLFSPFWLINKTGEMLSYKTDSETVEVLYHPPEYSGPILFSLRDKYLFDKKSCSIRVENGEWSNKIPLDVAGSTGSIGCKANDKTYQIGVHNHLTQNSLTKQITFIPYYTITNKCDYAIEIQENSRPGDPWAKLLPNVCFPLWPKNDSDHMMVARVDGQRTVPFNYSEPICILLQLNNNKNGGINVDVQCTEGGIYITFTEYNAGDAPGLLINHTKKPIHYHEKGVNNEIILQQQQKVLYTWSKPDGERVLVFGKNSLESDLRRDGIGHINLDDNTKVYWVSFLNGLQRVLLFTTCEEIVTKSESSTALQSITQSVEVKIHGIGLSLINNETGVDILYLGITSSGVIWEYKKENKKRFKQLSLHDTALMEALYQEYLVEKAVHGTTDKCYMLEGKHQVNFDALKMTKNNVPRDIQRYFQPGVWIALNSSPFQSQIHAKINRIQLDNQLTDCIFPVVLAPIPPPKTLAKTIHFKPIIEVSIVERVVPHSNVKQYKYAKMLMQEFHFKVDLVFLMAIAELFTSTVDDEREAKLFKDDVDTIEKPLSDLVQTQSQQQQKNFYDNLHLGPMKVHVSFSMAGVDTSVLPGILSKLVQGVGVTLTDVNDVVIRLAFFEREYRFFTQEQLISEITSHYTGQALKQIYVLVLGLDVLGNPYGLVIGIKKGVGDLFYEPFQGAIQGPGEFAEGLVLGVKSLVGHTVGGAAGAVSKITGAMGKGLAVLTFDEDYQKKRRQNLNSKPKTFQEGMARSGKGLVMGFVDGVTGCVTKPITGAKEEGVEGFFKGLGKGTIGLVTRPTAGIVDFAHGTFDSVKRATELQSETRRLRPPRFVHEDKILRPYCLDEAKGNQLLKEIDKGKYASTDSFIHCEEIIQKQEYVVVSNHRIIYVTRNDMFGSWSVQWTYLWSEIEKVYSTDRGVEILLKKEGKKVLGLFNTSEQQHKLIIMPLKKRRDLLLEAIESHRSV